MKNINYMMAAYGLAWVILVAYMMYLHLKVNRLAAELEQESSSS